MNIKKFTSRYASLLLLALQTGCGGGGGGTTPTPNPALPVATVMQGVYAGSLDGHEFVSAVTPDADWFALYFLSTIPEIYSGKIVLGLNQLASIPSPGVRAFQNGNLLSGGARFVGASADQYNLSLDGFTSADTKVLSFNASTVVTVGSLPGSWTGTWTDSLDSKTRAASVLNFSPSGVTTSFDFFSNCDRPGSMPVLSLTSLSDGIYSVKLQIPQITACDRTPVVAVELNGVAFVHASSLPGKTLRLDLIAIDSTGSGVSFRGDR